MDVAEAVALVAAAQADRLALRGPEADAAMARLEAAYPRYGEAFELLIRGGRPADAAALAGALVPFWMATKRIDEGSGWLTTAADALGDDDAARARALHEHGYLVFWAGRYDRSAELAREAVELGRRVNDGTTVSLALGVLARIALKADVEEAIRLLREAVAVSEAAGDAAGRSGAMHVLGVAYQMAGRLEEARAVMSERIASGRESGNEFLVASEAGNLSMVERQLGNLERAEALSREAIEIVNRRGDELAVPWMINGLAAVTAEQGDLERAAVLNGFAEAGIDRAGGEWPPDERVQFDGTLAKLRAGMPPDLLERARARGAAMSTNEGVTFALNGAVVPQTTS